MNEEIEIRFATELEDAKSDGKTAYQSFVSADISILLDSMLQCYYRSANYFSSISGARSG